MHRSSPENKECLSLSSRSAVAPAGAGAGPARHLLGKVKAGCLEKGMGFNKSQACHEVGGRDQEVVRTWWQEQNVKKPCLPSLLRCCCVSAEFWGPVLPMSQLRGQHRHGDSLHSHWGENKSHGRCGPAQQRPTNVFCK